MADPTVRLRTNPDGTAWVRVHGCPLCTRWTRSWGTEPRRYPHHEANCEGRWELWPMRVARVDTHDEGGATRTPRILEMLDEGVTDLPEEP